MPVRWSSRDRRKKSCCSPGTRVRRRSCRASTAPWSGGVEKNVSVEGKPDDLLCPCGLSHEGSFRAAQDGHQELRGPRLRRSAQARRRGRVHARGVAEHAVALILAVARRLPEARDNQHKKMWRGMLGDLTQREDELGGKTLLVVAMGRIGSHPPLL